MFQKIADFVFPDQKVVIKADKEPQSEIEESKDQLDFTKEVVKECKKFVQYLENHNITQKQDITDLLNLKNVQLQQIEMLGKFADGLGK